MRRPIAPDELMEMYALIGKAVWACQNVENTLQHFATFALDLVTREMGTVTQEEAQLYLDQRRRKTLGPTIKSITKNNLVSEEAADTLSWLLDERNWLMHNVLYWNADDLYKGTNRDKLFVRINKIADAAFDVNNKVSQEWDEIAKQYGVYPAKAEKEARAQLRSLSENGS